MRCEDANDEGAALGDNEHDRDQSHHDGQHDEVRHEDQRGQHDDGVERADEEHREEEEEEENERFNAAELGEPLRTARVDRGRGAATQERCDE